MALLVNQIRVLLQRVKMAGREPYKILMHQGLRDNLRTELGHTGILQFKVIPDTTIDKARKQDEFTFLGLPVVVDNTLKEILIQVKPRKMAEEEPVPKLDWAKIIKVEHV